MLCFGLFDKNVFFASSQVIIAFVASQTTFADRQYARAHRAASDVLLVACKWRYCCRLWALHGVSGVPIGALLVVLQQWLLIASVCRTFLVG